MDNAPAANQGASVSAQRRYLTLLFADLSGSLKLAQELEAEHYSDLIRALRLACREVISKHGGTIVRAQGDGVLAVFGFPEAWEDEGRRATEAALELHERVRRIRFAAPPYCPPTLTLHTGIHSGLVLVDEGGPTAGLLELLGDAPSIAARLSAAAGSDEILVSRETLGPEADFFRGPSFEVLLKGRSEPIRVQRILARATVATRLEARARRGLVPFTGRQRELATLDLALEQAIRNGPKYAAIVAPLGLGKTRLAREFLRHAARKCEVHVGYCENYLGAEPLQPFLQMLRSLFGLSPGTAATSAGEHIEGVLSQIDKGLLALRHEFSRALSYRSASGDHDMPRDGGDHVIAALRELFDRLAARGPVAVFIDDLQWADDATRGVLHALRQLPHRPLLVLVATRGSEAADLEVGEATVVELSPFGHPEASAMIERLLPDVDPFLVEEITRYSGGNPLFIEELCHSAGYAEVQRRIDRLPGSGAWLSTLISSRIDRLPPRQAELVRTAAVIGTVIPVWLFEALTGCSEEHPLALDLADRDLVFPGEKAGTLRFKHGITRDVVYEAVGLHQRRALHLRIAEMLERRMTSTGEEEAYEALAYHYAAGGNHELAAHYAELAGDKARDASALDRAQAQYRAALSALDALPPSPERYGRWIAIARRFGLACVYGGARSQLDVLTRAVELAQEQGDSVGLAHAEYWLGYVLYALGDSRAAIRHLEAALGAATRTGDAGLVVHVRATLGQAMAAACQYDRALVLLDEAIAAKRPAQRRRGAPAGAAYSLACRAAVLGHRGRFSEAHACFDDALDAVRGMQHVVEGSVLCWRSAVYLWQGRWLEARETARRAQKVAERLKTLLVFGMSRSLGAYAEWMLQRQPESVNALVEATTWLEGREKTLFRSLNYGWLAEVMEATGQFEEARRYGVRAMARARQDDRVGEAMACRALARVVMSGHTKRTPAIYLARANRVAQALGSPLERALNLFCEAEIAASSGEPGRAADLIFEAKEGFEALQMHWHLAEAEQLHRQIAATESASTTRLQSSRASRADKVGCSRSEA